MKRISFLLASALLFVSFSLTASAATKQNSQISKAEVKSLLRTGKTAADHHRIAGYYRQEAQRLVAESKFHEEMAGIYRSNPLPFEAKHPYGTVGLSHCHYWAQLDLDQAKEAEAMATLHEAMAAAAEKK